VHVFQKTTANQTSIILVGFEILIAEQSLLAACFVQVSCLTYVVCSKSIEPYFFPRKPMKHGVSAKFVPKLLTMEQKQRRLEIAQDMLDNANSNPSSV
jgi:hypothetical protein